MRHAHLLPIAALALTLSAGAQPVLPDIQGPARAPAHTDDRGLSELIESLAAPDLLTRRAATDTLRTREDISLKQIEQTLRTARLTPEQHRRLLSAAWHRFRSTPRPAMGVRTDAQPNLRGANIASITRGFPAESVLRPGDRIEALDGFRLDDFNTLRHIILARDPGDELPATVIRDGAVLNLRVKLGRYEDLNQQLSDGDLMAAFRQFRARDYFDYRAEPPIDSGVEPDQWSFHHANDVDEEWSRPIYATGEIDPLNATAGGEPRGGRAVIVNAPRPGNARMADDFQEMRFLQAERLQLQTEIARLQLQIENPATRAEDRRGLLQLVAVQRERIRMIEAQLNQRRPRR
jgi:hypothetical protein